MLNVAVIGLGWWGKTLVAAMKTSPKLKVVKAMKRSPQTEAEFARAEGLEIVGDYASVLRDPNVHAVLLCTPHTLHAEQILAAVDAGKHVFCEKPLCLTANDARRAIAAVNAQRVTIGVGHERRYEPPIVDLLRSVNSGELGTPLQVEANFSHDRFLSMPSDNWRLTEKEAPAGPMTGTGIHLLDLSVAIFGEAESALCSVKRLASHLANGDTLAALVTFRSGGHALISAIFATPFDGRFAVYCSKGWIEVRDKSHPASPLGWTMTKVTTGDKRIVIEYPAASGVLANLEAFADAAEGRAPYSITQEQMIWNIAALEAVVESAASGRKVTVK